MINRIDRSIFIWTGISHGSFGHRDRHTIGWAGIPIAIRDEQRKYALCCCCGSETWSGRGEIRKVVNTRSIVNPITAGKITGKIGGNKNTVSAIAAIDELDTSFNANVAVMRYKRAFQKDSYLGGFWTGRTEADYSDQRHPDKLDFTEKIEDDLARRDFTINAIAAKPADESKEKKEITSADIEHAVRRVGTEVMIAPITDNIFLLHIVNVFIGLCLMALPFGLLWLIK